MRKERFEGEVSNVEYAGNGFCRIRVNSAYSEDVYEVEIGQKAIELINYNLEEVKKNKEDAELVGSSANIYFYKGVEKLEIVFIEPMLYSISFACHKVEKLKL